MRKILIFVFFVLILFNATSQNKDTVFADTTKGIFIMVNKTHKLLMDFVPADLVKISEKHGDSTLMIKREVYKAYIKMYDDAKNDGVNLWITSAYRTYQYQKQLYDTAVKKNGIATANKDTAKPGFSEHQTGLAIDIVIARGYKFEGFEKTKQFKWLSSLAHEYGFILRYPKDKEAITSYMYEPWHYRYVGIETAKKIKELNITYEEYYEQFINNQ